MKFTSVLLLASTLAFTEASLLRKSQTGFHDYGEIRIAVTTSYADVYNDRGTGARRNVAIWHPRYDGGFRALGSIAENTYTDGVNGKRATVVAMLNPHHPPADHSRPALKEPTGWSAIWNDKGSGGKRDGSFWRPNCPNGYVSLGDVGSNGYGHPSYAVWCLRQDLAVHGKYKTGTYWDDGGSGAYKDAFLWEVIPAPTGVSGEEHVPLYVGTFRVVNARVQPDIPAWTLSIDIPRAYTPFKTRAPKVTADSIPHKGELFSELKEAEVALPLTAYFSPKHTQIIRNIANPFAKITKSVAWYVEGVWENGSPGEVTRRDTIHSGYSKSDTKSMETSVGISVSATTGISMSEYSVSLNYQFTASQSHTFSEFSERTREEAFNVPAHTVAVLFCKRIRLSVTTMSGGIIHQTETLATNEFHISSASLQ